jgi:hypothetical protein
VNPSLIVGAVAAWYALLAVLVEAGRSRHRPMEPALHGLVSWTSGVAMLFASIGFVIGVGVGMYAAGGREPAAEAISRALLTWSIVVGVGGYVAGRALVARGCSTG